MRQLTFAKAIQEATDQCLANDPAVYIIGLGVPDPKGVFGTTVGLAAKYGNNRVMDMPVSENGMTGIVLGSAILGMRPIMTHQRVDFMLLSLDQLINNVAKWHYMFGGLMKVPLVIRILVGRGWGQGPQHSQNLPVIFAHIPGLKVVIPTFPDDAKGLLIAAVEDNNPVIYIEHRWLHEIQGTVPEEMYRIPLGKAKIVREGNDITLVASSYMTLETIKAASLLEKDGISSEIIDLRSVKPLDKETILHSVEKTGRLVVIDGAWRSFGIAAEIITLVSETGYSWLKSAPQRVTLPDVSTPTSWMLANHYYPRAIDIVNVVRKKFGLAEVTEEHLGIKQEIPLDVPDKSFTGPF